MSYHVTILRTANGSLQPIPFADARVAAEVVGGWRVTESPPALEREGPDGPFTLRYQDGELWAKSPGNAEIEAMLRLAGQIGARVRGDEYETYETPERTYDHPDDAILRIQDEERSRELLARDPLSPTRMRNYIIGFFVVLGVIAYLVRSWFETR